MKTSDRGVLEGATDDSWAPLSVIGAGKSAISGTEALAASRGYAATHAPKLTVERVDRVGEPALGELTKRHRC